MFEGMVADNMEPEPVLEADNPRGRDPGFQPDY